MKPLGVLVLLLSTALTRSKIGDSNNERSKVKWKFRVATTLACAITLGLKNKCALLSKQQEGKAKPQLQEPINAVTSISNQNKK